VIFRISRAAPIHKTPNNSNSSINAREVPTIVPNQREIVQETSKKCFEENIRKD
jgi:hypothetical protein